MILTIDVTQLVFTVSGYKMTERCYGNRIGEIDNDHFSLFLHRKIQKTKQHKTMITSRI